MFHKWMENSKVDCNVSAGFNYDFIFFFTYLGNMYNLVLITALSSRKELGSNFLSIKTGSWGEWMAWLLKNINNTLANICKAY